MTDHTAGPGLRIPQELAGEEVFGSERLVLTPAAGRFVELDPEVRPRPGDVVLAGQPLGLVEGPRREVLVRSFFSGVVAGMMARDGERVDVHQPVAWLRVAGAG